MASTWSNLKIQLMGAGDESGTWGIVTNANLGTAIEEAISGTANVSFSSADVTLTLTDTTNSQTARNMRLNLTGTSGGARILEVPAIEKLYVVNNALADQVTVQNATGSNVVVPAGKTMFVFNTGSNVVDAVTHLSSLTLNTPLPVASGGTGSNTGVNLQSSVSGVLPIANGGTGSNSATFSGANITSLNATAISSGTLDNARTSASSSNGASTIVARDASGNFSANTITAALTGIASGNLVTSDYTGANQSISASGFQKLPGGLIVQWGTYTQSSGGFTNVTFPTAFPSTCYYTSVTRIDPSSTGGVSLSTTVRSYSTTTASYSGPNGNSYLWIALGY